MFSTFLWSNEQGTTLPHNTLATITPQLAHEDAAVPVTSVLYTYCTCCDDCYLYTPCAA
uniref:Uncharacterized protein n=1 Tax=Fusarium oxysporum (strain Fo5176) TaxID=660025 RepID=A0A0D2YJC5_FUSOF